MRSCIILRPLKLQARRTTGLRSLALRCRTSELRLRSFHRPRPQALTEAAGKLDKVPEVFDTSRRPDAHSLYELDRKAYSFFRWVCVRVYVHAQG